MNLYKHPTLPGLWTITYNLRSHHYDVQSYYVEYKSFEKGIKITTNGKFQLKDFKSVAEI